MKPITKIITEEKIVGYEATDGTRFSSKEECEKYEKTAKAVILGRFRDLIVREVSEDTFSHMASECPALSYNDEWYFAVIRMENENDLKAANMFAQSAGNANRFSEDMIGKDILVSTGNGAYDTNCYIFGTIEETAERYRKALLSMLEPVSDEERIESRH